MIRYLYILLALFILFAFSACASKTQEKKMLDSPDKAKILTPFEQLSFKSEGKTVFEDEGKFILIEGSKCMQRDNGAEAATVLQWIEMPGYVDSATVVLNGWDLRYLQKDREVNSMKADIIHSKLVKSAGSSFLVFEVQGKLDDQNRADAYEFCVFYSGFGYRSVWFDAAIEWDYNGIEASVPQNKTQGAVATVENLGSKGTLKGNDVIAIIPRGFDFQFDDTFECELRFPPCKWVDRADYRLLQAAYSLSQTGASPNRDGSPHWVTQTILKDNDTRTHRSKTRPTQIRGSSVQLRADALALNPSPGKTATCRQKTERCAHRICGTNRRSYSIARRDRSDFDHLRPAKNHTARSAGCARHRAGVWRPTGSARPKLRSLAPGFCLCRPPGHTAIWVGLAPNAPVGRRSGARPRVDRG